MPCLGHALLAQQWDQQSNPGMFAGWSRNRVTDVVVQDIPDGAVYRGTRLNELCVPGNGECLSHAQGFRVGVIAMPGYRVLRWT